MALLIDTSLNILGSVEVSQLYIRMFYSHDIPGNNIHVSIEKYLNKESFEDNIEHNLEVEGIPYQLDLEYDRSTDGVDTLLFVHNKIREYLSTDVSALVAQTDPSGNIVTDASGNVIYNSEIVQPKFTDISNIEIVDVSI